MQTLYLAYSIAGGGSMAIVPDPLNPLIKLGVPVGPGEEVKVSVHPVAGGATFVEGGSFTEAKHLLQDTHSLIVTSSGLERSGKPGSIGKVNIHIVEGRETLVSLFIGLVVVGDKLTLVATTTEGKEVELSSIPFDP